tara:strand:- start:352 stop:702 length:351 start_codon:yes stop_codon:yes gene_type:complete
MFTEDYVDSYALHRTSTGPGINSYVPTADLNLKAQKKVTKKGNKKMSGTYNTKEGTYVSSIPNVVDAMLGDIKDRLNKELQKGKIDTFNRIAGLVGQRGEFDKEFKGRTGRVMLKR